MWALRRSDGCGSTDLLIVALTIGPAGFPIFIPHQLARQARTYATEAVMAPPPCKDCPSGGSAGGCEVSQLSRDRANDQTVHIGAGGFWRPVAGRLARAADTNFRHGRQHLAPSASARRRGGVRRPVRIPLERTAGWKADDGIAPAPHREHQCTAAASIIGGRKGA